jgi:histone deacetylase complex regulatory component SIN3
MINNSDNPLFDEAMKYVNKVKNAFRDEKHIYQAFLGHMEDFKFQRKNIEILKEK